MSEKKTGNTGWDANSVPSNPDLIYRNSVVPSSPGRPARNVSRHDGRQRSGGLMLPMLALIGAGAVGWVVYRAVIGGNVGAGVDASKMLDEGINATKRAAKAAQAAVGTTIREPGLAKRGHNADKGPKFAAELAENKRKRAEVRKELAARGLTPPLTRKEVDRVFARAKRPLRNCYRKHFANLGNFHRVHVDADIGANGRVADVSLNEEDATDALRACVGKAVKRLRFRSKREASEAHQLFVLLGKVKRLRK